MHGPQGNPLNAKDVRQRPSNDWQEAKNPLDSLPTSTYDVLISHAGYHADKPFARDLALCLWRSWNLRVFLDEDSLPGGSDGLRVMTTAMEETGIAVLLLSEEFFERDATRQSRSHTMLPLITSGAANMLAI